MQKQPETVDESIWNYARSEVESPLGRSEIKNITKLDDVLDGDGVCRVYLAQTNGERPDYWVVEDGGKAIFSTDFWPLKEDAVEAFRG